MSKLKSNHAKDGSTVQHQAEDKVTAETRQRLVGRDFYKCMGSPRTIVAPMVEQSELAWRLLSRRHSPPKTLCYTPMFHSHLFATAPVYRRQSFQSPHLDGNHTHDRPIFVQFCSNDPDDLLAAARFVEDHCDAVDLNLGCPQGIARKGNYGAFLQEKWDLIHSLIKNLHENLKVPITAKIRVLETKEQSLDYAKMIVDAGASVLTVHGRRREQKGHNTGLADWSIIRHIRENIPQDIVIFANGNILWHEDVERCLEATGVDGVMSAEGNLYNPAIFETSSDWNKRFPRMDDIGREYLTIIRDEILPHLPLKELLTQESTRRTRKKINEVMKDPSLTAIKSHLFKMWHTLLSRNTEIRDLVAMATSRHADNKGNPLAMYEDCLAKVEKLIEEELKTNPEKLDEKGHWLGPDEVITGNDSNCGADAVGYIIEVGNPPKKFRRKVPWYRCQPYYRPLPEEAIRKGAMTIRQDKLDLGSSIGGNVEDSHAIERSAKRAKIRVHLEAIEPIGEAESRIDDK